jgi:hypothetical protein
MKQVVALLFLLVLSSYAGPSPAATKMAGIKTVGIVSAVGDRFYVHKRGVLQNDRNDYSIAGWGLDDFMIARVRAALSGRLDVRPVKYRKAAFAALAANSSAIVNAVRSEVTPQGLDAYIVIVARGNMYGQTDPMNLPGGFGIFLKSDLLSSKYIVHANYEITVLDGRQFEARARRWASLEPGNFGPSTRAAFREVDSSWWPSNTDVAANQQAQKGRIRADRTRPARRVAGNAGAGLGNSIPPPTQNQVVETSCWFESGQGHQSEPPFFGCCRQSTA